jgi:hypothetical protein
MNSVGNYVFCHHCKQSVSEKKFRRHMALDQSRQLKRSLNDDSSTSSSDTDEETVATFNSCDFGGL